jgi:hypothetical protein
MRKGENKQPIMLTLPVIRVIRLGITPIEARKIKEERREGGREFN